jgi:hypothetical protein
MTLETRPRFRIRKGKLVRGGKICQVCRRPDRAEIEMMMAQGASRRLVAKKFGNKPGLADAIYRHWNKCTSPTVRATRQLAVLKPGAPVEQLDQLVTEENIGLLSHLQRVRAGLYVLYDAAVAAGDRHHGPMIAAALHNNLRISAIRTGELQANSPTSVTNIYLSPEYLRLRKRLLAALRPFPEAALAVAAAFEMVEDTSPSLGRAPAPMIEGKAHDAV